MLEWIQILPEYQGQKLGQAIVNQLLMNLSNRAEFVTVSGEVRQIQKNSIVNVDLWETIFGTLL